MTHKKDCPLCGKRLVGMTAFEENAATGATLNLECGHCRTQFTLRTPFYAMNAMRINDLIKMWNNRKPYEALTKPKKVKKA